MPANKGKYGIDAIGLYRGLSGKASSVLPDWLQVAGDGGFDNGFTFLRRLPVKWIIGMSIIMVVLTIRAT